MNNRPVLPALPNARRRPIGAGTELITMGHVSASTALPLLIEARLKGLQLSVWAAGRRSEIERWVTRHGAVLFRGFTVEGVPDFERCVEVMGGGALEYRFRASPRTEVGRHVYTATDYPADQVIFAHNEHSYAPVCPLYLLFYAETPAPIGGETPIGDARAVTHRIDPVVQERFVRQGILYVRNYGDGFGLPWETVFQTTTRADVEHYCQEVGMQWEWKAGNRLCTRQVGPAMVQHPLSREQVWFNHGTFFHVTTLSAPLREALLAEFPEADLPTNTYYGDGSPIEPEVLEYLRAAYSAEMVQFSWQRGDVLMLDNILTVHARQTYQGFRRILVAMAQTFRPAELAVGPGEAP